MQEFKNWKDFINRVLIDSKKFKKSTTDFKEKTEIETYKSTDKNSLTEIKIGYLKNNLLIYLQVFNPITPGYNEYAKTEYFYCTDFDENDSRKDVGLTFNKVNIEGVSEILRNGIVGTEIQIRKNDKVLKSILYLDREENFPIRYDFTGRNFWKKIFSRNIEFDKKYQKKEIDLTKIFSGI